MSSALEVVQGAMESGNQGTRLKMAMYVLKPARLQDHTEAEILKKVYPSR